MASAKECLAAIDAAAKGLLSDDELEGLIEDLDSIRRQIRVREDARRHRRIQFRCQTRGIVMR